MREIFLCKYGEIILKGANRASFESLLVKELRYRLSFAGKFRVHRNQSVIYIAPADGWEPDENAYKTAFDIASRTFGIVAICRCAVAPKDFEEIKGITGKYLYGKLSSARTFKVETKRADKRFPMHSGEISAELGGYILSQFPNLRVDVHNPDVTVNIDIREDAAYVSAGQEKTAGGMPVGSNGHGMLLLSGGIDSPVAGWMMAKRGVKLDAVYFEAFPYTSIQAREKVIELAREVSLWSGSINLHIVSLTEIEEEIKNNCDEDYFTLILRVYMMKIASRLAQENGGGALITGESLGQVASQTMEAIGVTDSIAEVPVLRPCIGLDKEEIVTLARRVGTFETSILPYEDCCTVFTPRHPKTRPELGKVLAEAAKTDMDTLIGRAIESDRVEAIRFCDNEF